jgi:hypothetical protein
MGRVNIIEADSNKKTIKEKTILRGRFYPKRNKYKKDNIIIKTIIRQIGFTETL